ncbi:MAG: glycosyltransferase [Patescibacteria group bacterium]|nr:glycosyltransferase [Patescibacteria group bacterium]
MLKTFSKWNQNKEFILAVVGGRPFNLRELEEVEKLAMKDRVKILGFVDEIELNILYRNCVGFVFPSLYEGFGLPIIEALACGARVLAADIPAFKEVGGSLIDYFNPANEQSLLSALDGLVEGKHKSLDNHLRDTLIHRFDWRQTVAKTHELYDKLDKR